MATQQRLYHLFSNPTEMNALSPLHHPAEFATLTAAHVAFWGGTAFLWQLLFSRYARWLETKGYLQREAHEPTLSQAEMLRQGAIGITGVALPLSLALAFLRPVWTFPRVTLFGSLALIPYVFAMCVLYDAYFYWAHRLAHAVPWIYRLVHKKHHLPQAALDAGSTSYMSFLEGFFVIGIPLVPIFLVPHFFLGGNTWAVIAAHYTVVSLFYLGHTGAAIKKNILPVFLLNPYLIVLGITANAHRPQDHTAHHERVMCNYAVFFRFWDELCGTSAPPPLAVKRRAGGGQKEPQQPQPRLKDLPISWRVTVYNALNSFSFLGVLLMATGAPRAFACAVAVAALLPSAASALLVRFEAGGFRLLGLTGLVTSLSFWDGLRRDLRVTLERDDGGGAGDEGLASSAAAAVVLSSPPHGRASHVGVGPGLAPQDGDDDDVARHHLDQHHDGAACVVVRRRSSRRKSPPLASSSSSSSAVAAAAASSPKRGKAKQLQLQHKQEQHQEDQRLSFSSLSPPVTPVASASLSARRPPRERSGSPLPQQQQLPSGDLGNNRSKLYVYHPRGDLMRGAFFAFGARGRDPTHPLAAERDVRLALPAPMARVLLRLPLLRELVALLGGVDPSSITSALKSGASVAVCLPGPPTRGPPRPAVAPETAPAFLRAALATGAALVPVVAVGEAELAGRLPLRDKWVMPSRPGCPVRVIVGESIVPAEGESAQRLRARFAAALAALAARHGAPPPEPADL